MTFEASPLEHDPIRMIPAAISGGKLKTLVNPTPTSGITEKWQTMPTSTPRGLERIPTKSLIRICVPIPNITICTTNRINHGLRRSKSPHFRNTPGTIIAAVTAAMIQAVNR